jgi:hypothetical protein
MACWAGMKRPWQQRLKQWSLRSGAETWCFTCFTRVQKYTYCGSTKVQIRTTKAVEFAERSGDLVLQYTCFTSTRVRILTKAGGAAGAASLRTQGARLRFTCFTIAKKVQILTRQKALHRLLLTKPLCHSLSLYATN